VDASKPWSISASLRGFYDDNIYTQSGSDKTESFGFSISPTVGYAIVQDQTTINGRYTYSGSWYEKQTNPEFSKWRHTHDFEGDLLHAFSPRANVSARDSFVIGQEPDFLRAGDAFSLINHTLPTGDNIRNAGKISFDYQVTRQLGLEVGYGNNYWDYNDSGVGTKFGGLVVASASLSGLLDRLEHSPLL